MAPPDPAIVGPDWLSMRQERLQGHGIRLHDRVTHQRRDRASQSGDAAFAPFAPPETSAPLQTTQLVPAKPVQRQVLTDQITGLVTTLVEPVSGLVRHDGRGMCLSGWHRDTSGVHPDDPATAMSISAAPTRFCRSAPPNPPSLGRYSPVRRRSVPQDRT